MKQSRSLRFEAKWNLALGPAIVAHVPGGGLALMQSYKQLRVWQRAHALTLAVYRLVTNLPADERFGLCSQLRRAAASVPTNIVEGSKRQTNADYARFLNIAEASLAETEYLLLLALDLGYLSSDAHQPVAAEIDEVARMLYALRTKVEHGDS